MMFLNHSCEPNVGVQEHFVFVAMHDVAAGEELTLDYGAQEEAVMVRAGCEGPTLDAEDIEYSREVVRLFRCATDMRTAVDCKYGDNAGATLEFTLRGLSDRAGLALVLHDSRAPSCRWAARALFRDR